MAYLYTPRRPRHSFDSTGSDSIFDDAGTTTSSFTSHAPSSPPRKSSLAHSFAQALHTDAYSRIRDVPLYQLPSGERIPAARQLWKDAPALFYVVRRAGCPLCRAQALLIANSGPFLRRLGYNLIAVLNDADDVDMVGFAKKHWSGKLVIDQELAFHLAVGDGAVRMGKASDAMSWGFTKRIWRSMVQNRVMGTSKAGNGPYMGGVLLVMSGDEGIAHTQIEDTLGDFGSFVDVLRAAYDNSPRRRMVPVNELDQAIEAHKRRATRKLPKQCGCEGLSEYQSV